MLDVYCIHLYRLEEGCDSIDYIMTHEKGQKGKTLTADFVQLTLLLLWTRQVLLCLGCIYYCQFASNPYRMDSWFG